MGLDGSSYGLVVKAVERRRVDRDQLASQAQQVTVGIEQLPNVGEPFAVYVTGVPIGDPPLVAVVENINGRAAKELQRIELEATSQPLELAAAMARVEVPLDDDRPTGSQLGLDDVPDQRE
jgi:hypothetical protein